MDQETNHALVEWVKGAIVPFLMVVGLLGTWLTAYFAEINSLKSDIAHLQTKDVELLTHHGAMDQQLKDLASRLDRIDQYGSRQNMLLQEMVKELQKKLDDHNQLMLSDPPAVKGGRHIHR